MALGILGRVILVRGLVLSKLSSKSDWKKEADGDVAVSTGLTLIILVFKIGFKILGVCGDDVAVVWDTVAVKVESVEPVEKGVIG